ncbi:MAG: ATP-binding protein [Bacteroidia bacterium]
MNPEENDKNTHPQVRATILVGFFLALSAVAGMSYFAYDNVKNLAYSLQVAINPDTFYNELSRLQKGLVRTNESVRNYTITRDPQTLSSYHESSNDIFTKINNLENFSAGNLRHAKAVDTIHDLIVDLRRINDSIITLGDEKGEVINTFTELTRKEINELSRKDFKEDSFITSVPVESQQQKVTDSALEPEKSLDTSQEKDVKKSNWLTDRFRSKKKKKEEVTQLSPTPAVPKRDTVFLEPKTKTQFSTEVIPAYELARLRNNTDEILSEAEIQQLRIMGEILVLTEKSRKQMTLLGIEFQKLESAKELEKGNIAVDAGILVDKTLFQLKVFGSVLIFIFALLLGVIYADMNHNHRLQVGLRQEKARAEKLGKAKEEFLANMSHEIRTPMNAVIGFAEQLSETSLNHQQKGFLQPIRNSAKYLLGLINDILDYSKIESGNFHLEIIGFRPLALIESVKDTFSFSAQNKGISLICESHDPLPEVLVGDPLRLKQMLFNLVSNAIKFTHEGEVKMRAYKENASEENSRIVFEVSDTGIGIPPGSVDKIFVDFVQADNSTTRKYGGTGLGLSITKKLTEMMGGEIVLTSEEGAGTQVKLIIPLPVGKVSDLPDVHAAVMQESGLLAGKRALIADDEPYNRLLIKTIMDKWGVNADVVENGREVMKHLESNPAYDFILMDLQMPEMDGFETSSTIRTHLGLTLPILALTATATPAEILTIESNGMNGYLLKPFDQGELYSRLVGLLGLKGNTRTNENHLPKQMEIPPNGEMIHTEPVANSYNLDQLFHLANQDKNFVVSMLNIFLSNATGNLEKLNQGATEGDWGKVSMAAHKMIPPSRHLGLNSIVDKLKAIELNSQSAENTENIPAEVEVVSDEIRGILAEIGKDVGRLKG